MARSQMHAKWIGILLVSVSMLVWWNHLKESRLSDTDEYTDKTREGNSSAAEFGESPANQLDSAGKGQTDYHSNKKSTQTATLTKMERKETTLRMQPKQVLFYTTFYGRVFNHTRYSHWRPEDCTYQCTWTNDRSRLNESDAVIYSVRNWLSHKDFTIRELPLRRKPDQIWAMIIKEPQAFFHPDQLKLLNNKFNLSVTFQSDSDVTIPHGTYRKLSSEEIHAQSGMRFSRYFNKPGILAWMVSNCMTSSKRENYVSKLKKYIRIDIYGGCAGKSPAMGTIDMGRQDIALKYKFYLAFENSDCDDYVTEKFWQYMTLGMVPVVRGSRVNYTKIAPPNSFIHADSFDSAEELANHIKAAARSRTLFYRYHEWRKHYRAAYSMFSTNYQWMCDFCEKVYENKHQIIDVYAHFSADTRCLIHTGKYDQTRKKERIQNIDP